MYFIRHGQAGTRHDYDRLSDIGREQSRLLGAWLAGQGLRFDSVWSGRLNRQRETAGETRKGALAAGGEFPEISLHAAWDEFDLDAVYQGIGPQLAGADEEFRRQREELQRQALDANSPVHRNWAHSDTLVVRAWVDARYTFEGESFAAFVSRVRGGAEVLAGDGVERKAAVFTSATPAAIWAGMALDLEGRKIMQLAGVTYNTAVTVLRVNGDRVRLVQFNSVAHIAEPRLLTHR